MTQMTRIRDGRVEESERVGLENHPQETPETLSRFKKKVAGYNTYILSAALLIPTGPLRNLAAF